MGKQCGNSRFKLKFRCGSDFDQAHSNNLPENRTRCLKRAKVLDEDKPGLGQNFCLVCDRYFVSQEVLELHEKSKPHKKASRNLKRDAVITQVFY